MLVGGREGGVVISIPTVKYLLFVHKIDWDRFEGRDFTNDLLYLIYFKEYRHASTTMIAFAFLQNFISLQIFVAFKINAPNE